MNVCDILFMERLFQSIVINCFISLRLQIHMAFALPVAHTLSLNETQNLLTIGLVELNTYKGLRHGYVETFQEGFIMS